MSPQASALATPRVATQPMCNSCGSGPLLESELKRGLCPDCQARGRGHAKCRLCRVVLGLDDDRTHGFCEDCQTRPEAKRLLGGVRAPSPPPGEPGYTGPAQVKPAPPPAPPPKREPRPFTPADKSLIRNVHAFMPVTDLLRVLNERLHADVGADAVDYTLEQLHAEIATLQVSSAAADWSELRQLIAMARRCGVLEQITPQVIDDFAIVFQLSSAQHMHLRDVIRGAKEGV